MYKVRFIFYNFIIIMLFFIIMGYSMDSSLYNDIEKAIKRNDLGTATNKLRAYTSSKGNKVLKDIDFLYLLSYLYIKNFENTKNYAFLTEAKKQIERALKIDSEDSRILYLKALIYYYTDKYEDAISILEQLDLYENDLKIKSLLLKLYRKTGRDRDFIKKKYEDIISVAKNKDRYIIDYVEMLIEDKQYDSAIKYIDSLKDENLKLKLKGNLLFSEGKFSEAKDIYLKLIKIYPFDYSYKKNLAIIYFNLKQYKKSEQLLRDLVSAGIKDKDVYEYLYKIKEIQESYQKKFIIYIIVIIFVFVLIAFYVYQLTIKIQIKNKEKIINEFKTTISNSVDIDKIAFEILNFFLEELNFDKGVFFILNRDGTYILPKSSRFSVERIKKIKVNKNHVNKWISTWANRPFTHIQAKKEVEGFLDSFEGLRYLINNLNIRLIIPFASGNKLLGLILFQENDKSKFNKKIAYIKKNLEIILNLIEKTSETLKSVRFYEMSVVDEMTKLYNKRYFMQKLRQEIKRAKEYKQPLSLIMMDIDHFKKFNDTYGHQQGDIVLAETAKRVMEVIREDTDIPVRYGGEEFSVILKNTPSQEAKHVAERIRVAVESRKYRFEAINQEVKVTISLGIATFPTHAKNEWELIEKADKALYYSKKTGRNRSTVYKESIDKILDQEDIKERQEQTKEIKYLDITKEIPELKYIKEFDDILSYLEEEFENSFLTGSPLSLVFFKVPQRYISRIAYLIQENISLIDFMCRYSEDILMVILVEQTIHQAKLTTKQILKKLQKFNITLNYSIVEKTANVKDIDGFIKLGLQKLD